MKHLNLLKSTLLLFALIAGSTSLWALEKTETFESKATSTTYNSTVYIATSESSCGIAWTIYYGTVSTNDKISGRSAQMRWYASASSNYPYAKTTTAIDGLSNVSLKARTSSLDVKMDVCYSANGTSWTVGKTHTFTATGKGESVSLDIPSGNKYVKFEVSSSSTAPASDYYKLIIDDVVFTYTSSLVPATWSVDPASATVLQGENTTLALTTNYDGTLNFESANTDIATVSYNSSTKEITVNGVSAGTTTINVTGAATATYEAIEKTISVKVNYPEKPSNAIDEIGPLGYSYFSLTPTGSNTYVELNDASVAHADAYGVSITIARNGNSYSKPRFDKDHWRFYNGNTLTVEAPANSYIAKIEFIEPGTGKSWAGSMTADKGAYLSDEKTWYASTTDVTTVVLTNDATKRVGSIKVYLMVSSTPATITTAKYATFVSPYATDFSTTGVTVYTATAGATAVTLNEVASGKVPANTPVVLYKAGADGTAINVPVIASADDLGSNDLKVSTGTDVANMYVLADNTSGVGFYKWNGASDLSAGKVYLLGASSAREFLGFGDVTGIENLTIMPSRKGEGMVYDLQGRRVAQPTKGLYIVNGRKVIVP